MHECMTINYRRRGLQLSDVTLTQNAWHSTKGTSTSYRKAIKSEHYQIKTSRTIIIIYT